MNGKVFYAGDVNENTILYKYMSLNQFISFVELEKMYLTKVTKWEDNWEAPVRFIPRKASSGDLRLPSFVLEETLYGQCWSKNKDSDALWRIYCQKNDGIMIQTTAKKFNLLKNFKRAHLAEIQYYRDDQLKEAAQKIESCKGYGPIGSACLKREAFNHESEVRIIICQQDHREEFKYGCDFINFGINVLDFIEGIFVDPRSDDWFLDSIKKYSERKGFRFSPMRSELYLPNVFTKNQFYIEYKAVEE